MIRRTPARRLAVAFAATALVLTACGDDGGDDDNASGDNNESSAPEPRRVMAR